RLPRRTLRDRSRRRGPGAGELQERQRDRGLRRAQGRLIAALLLELLYAQAESRPDQTAVVYRDERLSFSDLVERIERLADGLAGQGIGAGDSVGLVLRDDPWFIASFHAIAALGARVVPANPAFKQAELDRWFRSTGCKAVI